MPRHSLLRKLLHKRGDAKQEHIGRDVQIVDTVPHSESLAGQDVSETTVSPSSDISQSEPLPKATSQQQPPTTASTYGSLPPGGHAADPADVKTSENAGETAGSSLPARLWDRAYDELKHEETALVGAYEKILSSQLRNGIGSTVTESQPNIIAQDDPDARRRQMTQIVHAGLEKTAKEARAKERAGVLVDSVLSLKNTISFAVQTVPQAALAWTGVCVVLEALANPIAETEANRKGIRYIVKRMDWYWSLSGSLLKDLPNHVSELSGARRQLEDQIVGLYKALLSYQIKSVYSYYRNRGLVFFRDMLKLDDWSGGLESIQNAEKCFRNDTQVYTAQQVLSHLEQLVIHARNHEIQQMSEKDQECLKHLRLTYPPDDKARIERTKGGLLHDAYRWVLDNPDFQRWRDHPEHRLLWIKGDPGKGKTMLLCGIINELDPVNRTNAADSCDCNLAYFFCQATDSRINNATAVLRGLIYLLIERQPPLISHVRTEYDRAGETLFKDANTWDALSRIFTNILRDPGLKTTYLAIDALDECETDQPQLLSLIAEKSSESRQVKWIVSSRNWPQIEEQLETATQQARLSLELNAEAVAAAVNAYIQHKVDQLARLKNYDSRTRETVHHHLSSHANGTFLWVALVCQALADPKTRKWHSPAKLQEFPPGLDSLYARMLDHIRDSEDADLCRHILAVATVVRRPITLDELSSLAEMPDYVSNDSASLEEIIQLCGSFLALRERTIYLIHQSAKDFLLGRASNKLSGQASREACDWVFPSGMEVVNRLIFSRSLSAMSKVLRRDIYGLHEPGFSIADVNVPCPDPLATVRYSCVFWVDHLCHSIHDKSARPDDLLQAEGALHTFLETKYLYWLEALSLLGAVPEGVIAMKQIESLLIRHDLQRSTHLAWDARRFALSYSWIIEHYPLQAYASALVFAPASSLIKKLFKAEEPDWIETKPPVEVDWNAYLQTLEGHDTGVNSIAFSPDGRELASGSSDRIKIWDPASGRCLQTLEGHTVTVESIAFSPDYQWLTSGLADKTIKIWDPASRRFLQTLEGHIGAVESIAFSPDGQLLASGSADMTIKIWHPVSWRCCQTLEGHHDRVRSVDFSPDRRRLASGSWDNTIKIWDPTSGHCSQTLEGHNSAVQSVAFSPDGQRLASGSYDNTIKIWDPAQGCCLQTFEGHSNVVASVAFSPNSLWLVSGSWDSTIKIWDPASGSCLRTLKGHRDYVLSVAFSPNSEQLASGSFDKTIRIWELGSIGQRSLQTPEDDSQPLSVALSPDIQQLAADSGDGTIKIWDLASGGQRCVRVLKHDKYAASSLAFSPDGRRLASGLSSHTICIWDVTRGGQLCIQTLEGHQLDYSVTSLAFSPDGQQLAFSLGNDTIGIWDLSSGRQRCFQIPEEDSYDGMYTSVAFSPDGRRLVSRHPGTPMTVKVWDSVSGHCLQTQELDVEGSWAPLLVNNSGMIQRYHGYDVLWSGQWITRNGRGVLWLPLDYRPGRAAVQGRTVAIGCLTGRVFTITFSRDI